jgi:predicted RNA-binding Zn ribbon-like protein
MTLPAETGAGAAATAERFEFVGGRLCLDFTNTVTWTGDGLENERLESPADLAAWGLAAGVLDDGQARTLASLAGDAGRELLRAALRLRAGLHGIFLAHAAGRAPSADDLAALNEALVATMPHLRVGAAGGRYLWEWAPEGAPDRVLWHVAWSAANLLTDDDDLARVRTCGSEDCGWLYVDESRNHSRRWCEMKSCGNRAKARRHYERKRARKVDPSCASPRR